MRNPLSRKKSSLRVNNKKYNYRSRINNVKLSPNRRAVNGDNSRITDDDLDYYILKRWSVSEKLRDTFINKIDILADELRRSDIVANIPARPARDYTPRENIISYLRSDEGFSPWLKAGVLTRPMIRELAPRAYTALGNYLRRYELPEDLHIPTKSETVEAEIRASGFAASDAVEARKVARISQAMLRRSSLNS